MPIRLGDGTVISGIQLGDGTEIQEVRLGDGSIIWQHDRMLIEDFDDVNPFSEWSNATGEWTTVSKSGPGFTNEQGETYVDASTADSNSTIDRFVSARDANGYFQIVARVQDITSNSVFRFLLETGTGDNLIEVSFNPNGTIDVETETASKTSYSNVWSPGTDNIQISGTMDFNVPEVSYTVENLVDNSTGSGTKSMPSGNLEEITLLPYDGGSSSDTVRVTVDNIYIPRS